ncbi:hypothetical protein BV379_09850 [Rhodovulum sulfidophilum]|nr:hypothetical protein BV379_09850 [Rhodovulum sulfidophilum]
MHLYAICFTQGIAAFKKRDGGLLRDQVPSDVLIGGAARRTLACGRLPFLRLCLAKHMVAG